MSDTDPAALLERISELELRITALDLRQAALVLSWFRAKSKREQRRVLAEMKAEIVAYRLALPKIPAEHKAAAKEFLASMRRLRKSMKA